MTPFRGGIQLVERNFLGRAIHIGGGFIWGSQPQQLAKARRQQGVRLFAKAPRLPGTRMGLSGTFYASSASEPYRVAGALNDPNPSLFRTFEYTRVGGILGASFPITSRFGFGIDYRFEQVGATPPENPLYVSPEGWTSAIDLGLLPGSRRLTSTNFTVNWDGRDRAALPELVKVAAGRRIDAIIRSNSRGAPAHLVVDPPTLLPRSDDAVYLAVDTRDPHWQEVLYQRDLAVHLSSPIDARGLRLRLLALPANGSDHGLAAESRDACA